MRHLMAVRENGWDYLLRQHFV